MPGFGLGTFGLGTFGIGAGGEDPPLEHDPALIGTPSSGTPVDLLCFIAFDRDLPSIPIMNGNDATFEGANSWSAGTDTQLDILSSTQAYAGTQVAVIQRNIAGAGNPSMFWWSAPGSVSAGRWWMALIYTRPGWLGAQARTVQGTVSWMTSGGTLIGGVTSTVTQQVGRYMPLCVVGLAPAGVDRLVFRATVLNAPFAEQHRFDVASVDYLGTNISARVKGSPSWRRGRSDELGPVEASTLTATLRNADGYLTPDSTTAPAPYAGNVDSGQRFVLLRRVNEVTYPEWAGQTESWEQTVWGGGWSEVDVRCTDGSKNLGRRILPPLPAEIMKDAPDAYFRLDEEKGATSAGSIAGDGGVARLVTSKYGTGASEFGAESGLPQLPTGKTADDGQRWLALNTALPTPSAGQVLDLSSVPAAIAQDASTGFVKSGWTAEIWAVMPAVTPTGPLVIYGGAYLLQGSEGIEGFRVSLGTDGKIRVSVPFVDGIIVTSRTYVNGRPVQIVLSYAPNSGGSTQNLRLRVGSENFSESLSYTGSMSTYASNVKRTVSIGGYYRQYIRDVQYAWRTPVAHVAFWDRVLSDDRVAAHRSIGMAGGGTETEAARTTALADLAQWPACWTRIDRGLSSLLPRSWSESSTLDLAKTAAGSATALVYFDAAGKLSQRNRHRRVNALPVATLSAADETPVAAKDFRPRKDDQFVENLVRVKRAGGATSILRDDTSIARYGVRAADDIELAVTSEEEPIAAGRWRLEARATNRARVATLVLQPGARPALWPLALTVEVGDRIRVQGLPNLAPATTLDCIVESVSSSSQGSPRNVEIELGLSPWTEGLYQMAELYEANEPFDVDLSTLGNAKCKLGWY